MTSKVNWKDEDFAIFILTHGRPDNVITYKTLKDSGYTGDIYIIIDNEDKTADEYYKRYGDKVKMFDKLEIAKTFDQADNFEDRRAIVYARNASFNIAKDLGIKYFMELDDDYTSFSIRINKEMNFTYKLIKNLDVHIKNLLDFYKSVPSLKAIAFSQGGDFIGGTSCSLIKSKLAKRKCMNSFICSTERPFKFKGRINEDVNTYTNEASKGSLFLTFPFIMLNQKETQTNKGGMTDIYKVNGTYIKSFYSVIFQPSSVKVSLINGTSSSRIHHRIKWKNTIPHILREEYYSGGKNNG